jgi:hypothetical protein
MAFLMDDGAYGGQLIVGAGQPGALGVGPTKIRGSGYIEGPLQIGNASSFNIVQATTMIGPLTNIDSPPPFIPGVFQACMSTNNSPYSLAVIGDAAIFDNLDVNSVITAGEIVQAGTLIISRGEVMSQCGKHVLSAKKNFDIPHPTKEGWRLTHTCIEGPEASVYVRGRVKNNNEIYLPEYWKGLVDVQTITVNLTPIGAHQDVIIKRWDEEKVYLQPKGGMPIDCFYYIMAERKDTEKLIPEYRGTIEDYPGDNSQRSIAGYHYDVKE